MRSAQGQQRRPSKQVSPSQAWGLNWNAAKAEPPAQMLQEAFRLAHFLFPNRSTAMAIVSRALDKIHVSRHREMKRLYQRDKHHYGPLRRIYRRDADMMQWLVMYESEQDEKAQELRSESSLPEMMKRYIKYLIQVSSSLSSFYVNIAVMRLLHDYSTSEAQTAYEALTGRFRSADLYRRAKGALMEKLQYRFGDFLNATRVEHGELRFEPVSDQSQWARLAYECLSKFAPWSTQGQCHLLTGSPPSGAKESAQHDSGDQNDREMRNCHVLIEPECYGVLLEGLKLDSPHERLSLPRFYMTEKMDTDRGQPPQSIPDLTQEELDQIQRRLAANDARRKKIHPQFVSIFVDGAGLADLDLNADHRLTFETAPGASLIEVRGRDASGDLPLATHFISYVDDAAEASKSFVDLRPGKLEIAVSPASSKSGEALRSVITVAYHRRFNLGRLLHAPMLIPGTSVRYYALIAITAALISWAFASLYYGHKARMLEKNLSQVHHEPTSLLPVMARAVVSYRLVPDEERLRGIQKNGIPEISVLPDSAAISLELPAPPKTKPQIYTAELMTFDSGHLLVSANSLPAKYSDEGAVVEFVIPSASLAANSYYTVFLRSAQRVDRFTFKVTVNH